MEKFLCVNCVKHFKNEEVFIRNQYCTGFCNLLHVMTVQAKAAKVTKVEKKDLKKKDREAA